LAPTVPTPAPATWPTICTLRHRDLRPLQQALARQGLSSLGRSEAHVLASLEQILARLGQRAAHPVCPAPDFDEGAALLQHHTQILFGPPPQERDAYIMVTLDRQAADDYAHVHRLVAHGMDCARINCAHDDEGAWRAMVGNIRRAERECGRRCRIHVDLAGHKLRTGPLAEGPPVRHLKVRRAADGALLSPGRLLLHAEGQPPAVGDWQFAIPLLPSEAGHLEVGDILVFKENRGRTRRLHILSAPTGEQWLATCDRGAYIRSGTPVRLLRRAPDGHYRQQAHFHLGRFPGTPVEIWLHEGEHLLLTGDVTPGGPAHAPDDPAHIGCTTPAVLAQLKPGDPVWIDDGKIGAEVERADARGTLLRITHAAPGGSRLQDDKGLNFPLTELQLPPLSDSDLRNLGFVCRYADSVGFSFVESADDMLCLMQELNRHGATALPIVAKIETRRAVQNLPEILFCGSRRRPLGVMIARGDLAVELGNVRLAEIQEEILWLCEAAHVPVIWATQVLESIAKKGIRSRPELTDAAMGVRAECVMLNKGPYIVDALQALHNILVKMQAHQSKKSARMRALSW